MGLRKKHIPSWRLGLGFESGLYHFGGWVSVLRKKLIPSWRLGFGFEEIAYTILEDGL